MKIKTEYQGNFNGDSWSAWDDDGYDGPGSPVGWGSTEKEAIDDLIDQIDPGESHQDARGDQIIPQEGQDSRQNQLPSTGLLQGWGPWDRGTED